MTTSSAKRPRRVLVVRVGAMGDVLHGMPAIAAMREALGDDADIGWAVEPRWASLLQASTNASPRTPAMPLVDRVHLVPTRAWSRAPLSVATAKSILALRRELRGAKYDTVLDLQGNVRSSVIARLTGAPRVIGPAAPREAPAAWLYRERVPFRTAHVVEQAAEIASAALALPLTPGAAPLPVDAMAERWCDAIFTRSSGPAVLLAPTAGWGAKQWPAPKFAALAAHLAAQGCRVFVNASSPEDLTAREVVEGSGGQAEVLACTLPQLVAVVRRCALVVAGDTGPMHLAAALGRPVVALFGPTDPARNGPYDTAARVLRDPSSITDHRRHVEAEQGLARIPVQDVAHAADELLRNAPVAAAEPVHPPEPA